MGLLFALIGARLRILSQNETNRDSAIDPPLRGRAALLCPSPGYSIHLIGVPPV